MIGPDARRRRVGPRGVLVVALLAAAAAGHACAEARSGMTPFVPPPPAGWASSAPPNEVEDENGMEPSVAQGYGPEKPGVPGFLSIVFTHHSRHDMTSRFASPRPLGPNPFAPQFVTSLVKVNELDAYLIYDAAEEGGVLQMRVGRILVGITGGKVSPQQMIAFASSVDTARLQKY